MTNYKLQRYQVSNETISLIDKADSNIKNDFYYRYAIQLLREEEYATMEKIVSTHLNFKSSAVDKLKDILKFERNNLALNQVSTINQKIEQLYNNALSTDELSMFYQDLDSVITQLKAIDSELSEKVIAIKPTLFNRLLINYISIEQFGNAINLIQKYPKFWEIPELLKNLGICCFCFTANGLLNEKNYKTVISGWLTSVYSDNVILKSLEDTSWDDNYTFSLADAIGSNNFYHKVVPENVNYDKVSETNISIGSTQRELIQQFEKIIYKEIEESQLSILVNDFYNKEKECLEKVIEILESDILFPTPYFAISHGLNDNIIQELDGYYSDCLKEEALEAGVSYIKNASSSKVYQYFFANDILERIKSAIERENVEIIRQLNTKENQSWIEKFERINAQFENSLFNSLSNKITEDEDNEGLIAIMEECISISPKNEKLKHQYSNYVASYCISRVNDDSMDNVKALKLMKGAYINSLNNPRICKNFITLIRFNLMDVLNDRTRRTTEIYAILDWLISNMSQTFRRNSIELSNSRNEIINSLREAGVNILLFEDLPFGRIGQIDEMLNAEGLKMKKVLTYLKLLSSQE